MNVRIRHENEIWRRMCELEMKIRIGHGYEDWTC